MKLLNMIRAKKKEILLTKDIVGSKLTFKILNDFFYLLSINDLYIGNTEKLSLDGECFKIVEMNSSHKSMTIGDNELVLNIDMMTDSGTIYLNVIYCKLNGNIRKTFNYSASFNGEISKNKMIERISFMKNEDDTWLETNINLICSCMLHTMQFYFTRWL